MKREFERRMNPETKEDFDLLYAALGKWRLEEMEKIDRVLSGAERKAALCQLLDQETQLIAPAGRHKIDADDENKVKTVQSFFDKAAAAKKWRGPDGCYPEMDTPYTKRAQELRDIYNSICMKYLTQDERLDVLLTLKHTVKEHDYKLVQEIIELIDQEAGLLMRGVRDGNIEGLRKRISTLFLHYIKTPTFNPKENDLRYLVEKIWNSQSIVIAWEDLYDLILVRWDKHREWSPWNCLLLIKEESSAHERLETLPEGYGKELIHKVLRKHALASNYLISRLPGKSEHMRTLQWSGC